MLVVWILCGQSTVSLLCFYLTTLNPLTIAAVPRVYGYLAPAILKIRIFRTRNFGRVCILSLIGIALRLFLRFGTFSTIARLCKKSKKLQMVLLNISAATWLQNNNLVNTNIQFQAIEHEQLVS